MGGGHYTSKPYGPFVPPKVHGLWTARLGFAAVWFFCFYRMKVDGPHHFVCFYFLKCGSLGCSCYRSKNIFMPSSEKYAVKHIKA